MSQFYQGVTSGSLPPDVPIDFVTQNGTAVPAANILIVNGASSTQNNTNGIISKGGVIGTGTSNEVDIVITNRFQGSTSTVGVATSAMITFTPTVIGTYAIEARVAAYNTTSTIGAAYSVFVGVRFDGVNSNLTGIADVIDNEEGGMSAANVTVTVAGANVLINGVGYALQTINWGAVGLYTFVGI